MGTLVYITVLGFFSDYTDVVYVKSFSTIFFASIVLEILTYLAFQVKDLIIAWLKDRTGSLYRMLMFFCVWLVMFLSKFIFIWVLDFLFGNYIKINGFFGILLVVLCVTIIHKLAYKIFIKLG
ncbi:hypothetical protein IPM44_04070 [bacterium]|nr:MAG: hypothetical protein IPM44_04070 [bacterium]